MNKTDLIKSKSLDASGKVWKGEVGERLYQKKKEITDYCRRNSKPLPNNTPYLFRG